MIIKEMLGTQNWSGAMSDIDASLGRYCLLSSIDLPCMASRNEISGGLYAFLILDLRSGNAIDVFRRYYDNIKGEVRKEQYSNTDTIVSTIRDCVEDGTYHNSVQAMYPNDKRLVFYPIVQKLDEYWTFESAGITREYPAENIYNGSARDVINKGLSNNDGVVIYQLNCWPWPLINTGRKYKSLDEFKAKRTDLVPLSSFKWY